MNELLETLRITLPIIQAPMAGVATPTMAAAVSNAGGLGSLGLGAADVATAKRLIAETRALTDRPFQVNLFCHTPPASSPARESAWLALLTPEFEKLGGTPPTTIRPPYASFVENEAMLDLLRAERPAVISFHFGLPPASWIAALRYPGVTLLGCATCLQEAREIAAAGLDGVIAQGYEAGGHRGVFRPEQGDHRLGTFALTRLLVQQTSLPVIAAGGVMDGAGIVAMLRLGASAAQLGTAFIGCPESAASDDYRATLFSPAAERTFVTRLLSGRAARTMPNRLTDLLHSFDSAHLPAYPTAYDAAKQLMVVAKAARQPGYGAYLAGQGAPLARALPAAELLAILQREMAAPV